MSAECAPAQSLDDKINAATTYGDFEAGVGGWEAQLTALGKIPKMGVPESSNNAREIAVDYAKANLALALAAIYDNPFAANFSKAKVRRGYNAALSALQDVLNRCARAGSAG